MSYFLKKISIYIYSIQMITEFKIIQSSPPHTGSTLLLNLIHGYLLPDEKLKMSESSNKFYIVR